MLEFEVKTCFCIWSWWRSLAEGGNLKFYSYRGGWGGRSCPRSVTTIHSVAVDRTPNLPIERGAPELSPLQPLLRFSLKYFVLLCEWALIRAYTPGVLRVWRTHSQSDRVTVSRSCDHGKITKRLGRSLWTSYWFSKPYFKTSSFQLGRLADFVMHYYFPVSLLNVATLGVRWHSHTPLSVIRASASTMTRSSFINWQFGWIEHNDSNKSYLFCSTSSCIFNSYIT